MICPFLASDVVADLSCQGNLSFRLLGWSAWTEALATPEDWLAWADAASDDSSGNAGYAPPGTIPMMLRRRATSVGRAALEAAMGLPGVGDARYILSSRHGELNRTMSILASLDEAGPVSAADFSMSVHHGLVGLLSIATKNTKGHSAVSAGPESFCYGLLEAAACFAENPDEPVILIHYDEKPDTPLSSLFAKPEKAEPIIAALCLGDRTLGDGPEISMKSSAQGDGPMSESLVLDFLRFLLSGEDTLKSRGRRLTWEWNRG